MTRMTKAQVVDENIALRHNLDVLERQYQDLSARYEALSTQYEAQINARATPGVGDRATLSPINEDEAFSRGTHATRIVKTSGPRAHASYAEYCIASRKAQRARGLRVITLQSREQWEARAPMEQAS